MSLDVKRRGCTCMERNFTCIEKMSNAQYATEKDVFGHGVGHR